MYTIKTILEIPMYIHVFAVKILSEWTISLYDDLCNISYIDSVDITFISALLSTYEQCLCICVMLNSTNHSPLTVAR